MSGKNDLLVLRRSLLTGVIAELTTYLANTTPPTPSPSPLFAAPRQKTRSPSRWPPDCYTQPSPPRRHRTAPATRRDGASTWVDIPTGGDAGRGSVPCMRAAASRPRRRRNKTSRQAIRPARRAGSVRDNYSRIVLDIYPHKLSACNKRRPARGRTSADLGRQPFKTRLSTW